MSISMNMDISLSESDGEGGAPLTPSDILAHYRYELTKFEESEVLKYPEIHYFGQRCEEKIEAPCSGPNDGYDQDNGEYKIVIGDHLAYRYEIVEPLGSGAFGQVVKAIDHSDNSLVAVKLIRNRKRVAIQAQSEIDILRHIREADPTGRFGIVIMFDDFIFRNHVCIVYEILGCNLYDEMKSHDFYPMKMNAVRQIAARVLVSLTFLWKENIMHCDLKPENILIKGQETTSVRVVDLGTACFDTSSRLMYIQSRFYRAPEVIMGIPYGKPIDLWSYACILCELLTGYPMFPGENEADQLFSIMEYLGPPPPEMISRSRYKNKYFSADGTPKVTKNPRGERRVPGSRSLANFLALPEDSQFISFINQFFVWDQHERVTPREAMQHPWIVEEFVFRKDKKSHEENAASEDDGDDDPFRQSATGGAGDGVIRTRPARTTAPIPQSVTSDANSIPLTPGMKPNNLVLSSAIPPGIPATNAATASMTHTATPTATPRPAVSPQSVATSETMALAYSPMSSQLS
ncbi:protein kinase, partial [Strigomonas culicis]